MTSPTPIMNLPDASAEESGAVTVAGRKPWCTPLVIVSAASHAEANVTVFTDGSDEGVQYGS